MFVSLVKWFEDRPEISYTITITGAIMIFWISSLAFPPSYSKGLDIKPLIYHFSSFFFFTGFLLISTVKGKYTKFFSSVLSLSLLYAVLDEVHQIYVVNRYFSLGDIFIDSFGILIAGLVYIGTINLRVLHKDYI